MIFLRPGHDSAVIVHGFNMIQPCLTLGINKTFFLSSDKLASMSPDGQTSELQAMSCSQGFQLHKSNMPSPWIQNSSLSYPRWKPSTSSQTAASHDPEILKTRPADSTSCDSLPHRFRTIWSNDWLCSES